MLRSLIDLLGSVIHARDGEIGNVHNFLFDDEAWTVRYMVVETGTWLASRKVLISPAAIGHPDWARKSIPVLLTKDQVRNSPDVNTEEPVSRQQELVMSQYYGWPAYWSLDFGAIAIPQVGYVAAVPADTHLRSAKEVRGYQVRATDGDLGQVEDFVINDMDWLIRYLAVKTGNWFSGHNLLAPTRWVERLSWPDRHVILSRSREEM